MLTLSAQSGRFELIACGDLTLRVCTHRLKLVLTLRARTPLKIVSFLKIETRYIFYNKRILYPASSLDLRVLSLVYRQRSIILILILIGMGMLPAKFKLWCRVVFSNLNFGLLFIEFFNLN